MIGDLGIRGGFTAEQVALARDLASVYESRGWQALPSRRDKKAPMCPYAHWWEGGGDRVADLWRRWPSGSVQVMLGRHWGLCVLDLDGQEAIDRFAVLCAERDTREPKTWVSSSGGGGRHLWFTLPTEAIRGPEMGRRRLWGLWDDVAGDWEPHKGIELLCDHCLVMAPPSIHPVTGTRYRFHRGNSPREQRMPARLPAWLWAMPAVEMRTIVRIPLPERPKAPFKPVACPERLPYRPGDVRAAILDKIALAEEWGLRIASRKPNAAGWIKCHDTDRPDNHPSAMFNPETGRFWRPGGRSICLFRLGVELGVYSDWRACCHDVALRFLPACERSFASAGYQEH
jgi:hypothetical protein